MISTILLGVIAFLLFIIVLRVEDIAGRLKERFETEAEAEEDES